MRSLETLHALVNVANIIVIHHTGKFHLQLTLLSPNLIPIDCGLVNYHNDHVRQELVKINPSVAHTEYLEKTDNGEILEYVFIQIKVFLYVLLILWL